MILSKDKFQTFELFDARSNTYIFNLEIDPELIFFLKCQYFGMIT